MHNTLSARAPRLTTRVLKQLCIALHVSLLPLPYCADSMCYRQQLTLSTRQIPREVRYPVRSLENKGEELKLRQRMGGFKLQ